MDHEERLAELRLRRGKLVEDLAMVDTDIALLEAAMSGTADPSARNRLGVEHRIRALLAVIGQHGGAMRFTDLLTVGRARMGLTSSEFTKNHLTTALAKAVRGGRLQRLDDRRYALPGYAPSTATQEAPEAHDE